MKTFIHREHCHESQTWEQNPHKSNIGTFLGEIGPILDRHMCKLEQFLLVGDFNSEICETTLHYFCQTYNLTNLVTEATCFKNVSNPSLIDLMLTNKSKCFQHSLNIESGLSDHHKMTVTVLKAFFPKQAPTIIKYRDFRNFNSNTFYIELFHDLSKINSSADYEDFESTFSATFDRHAPIKEKKVRANNAPFMNKILSKAIMTRTRLRNKFLRDPSSSNRANYKKQRNFCVSLLRNTKRNYYNNLDLKLITDNKLFWKTIKPLFSDKTKACKK